MRSSTAGNNEKSAPPPERAEKISGRHALRALNFFMADMQSGIGPFIGVFLLAHGWQSGWIGSVMTVGSIAGVLMTAPAGAWVDGSRQKRWLVVIPGFCSIAASSIILLWQSFWPVALSQVATAIAGAAIGPAVNGITLGMYKQARFNRQLGINQAYNHAGNAVGAGLSGYLGWKLGLPAVLWLAVAFGAASVASALMIPSRSIDDRAARGMREHAKPDERAHGLSVLLTCKPLVVLAISLALFHLGNGAMLPLYGLAVVAAKQADPAAFVAATIVVAQTTMVLASIVAMRMSASRGLWLVILISYLSLPVRGLIAAYLIKSWGVFPVQILDGVGAGLQSVAVPALVARILDGTGRINVGQGATMTVQGAGAALSPAIGGWVAQWKGYSAAFIVLGLFAVGAVVVWVAGARLYAPAAAQRGRLKPLAGPKARRAT
jgi:MFS family permease